MKKTLILPFAAAFLLLTACGTAAGTPDTTEPLDVTETEHTPETPDAAGVITYTIEKDTLTDQAYADDGTLVAEYSYEIPRLVASRDGTAITEGGTAEDAAALLVANNFNKAFENWQEDEFQQTVEAAKADYAWYLESDMEWGITYDSELSTDVYLTDRLVSVAGDFYSYSGGAHPNSVLLSWNYDLTTGTMIKATELSDDGPGLTQAVSAEIISQMEATATEAGLSLTEYYWQNCEEIVAQWPDYAVAFDENGMTVAFSAYELASYAAGPQVFTLSRAWLAPYLNDDGKQLLGWE